MSKQYKYSILYADGKQEDFTCGKGELTLDKLQEIVGGYIEILDVKDGKTLVVNEEGLFKNLSRNTKASSLYGAPLDGNVVYCDGQAIE
jgi:hypothetical protein